MTTKMEHFTVTGPIDSLLPYGLDLDHYSQRSHSFTDGPSAQEITELFNAASRAGLISQPDDISEIECVAVPRRPSTGHEVLVTLDLADAAEPLRVALYWSPEPSELKEAAEQRGTIGADYARGILEETLIAIDVLYQDLEGYRSQLRGKRPVVVLCEDSAGHPNVLYSDPPVEQAITLVNFTEFDDDIYTVDDVKRKVDEITSVDNWEASNTLSAEVSELNKLIDRWTEEGHD